MFHKAIQKIKVEHFLWTTVLMLFVISSADTCGLSFMLFAVSLLQIPVL